MNWRDEANCAGHTMVWDQAPPDMERGRCLDLCAGCDVRSECIDDMAYQGESFRFQVRGGSAVWITGVPYGI